MSQKHDEPPLHLSKISIRNVRCFKELTVDLRGPEGPRSWVVLFGDNSVGKTTFLRCVAMGMCDESSASGLLREVYGEWNRLDEGGRPLPAEIKLEFDSVHGKASIRTIIDPGRSGYSRVKQKTTFSGKSQDFPWDLIFACGYGAARRAFGTKDVSEYATIDSVYTLFNYDTPLQNPELVILRLATGSVPSNRRKSSDGRHDQGPAGAGSVEAILDSICAVLMLPSGSLRLDPSGGLSIAGPGGDFRPVGAHGDGFQATLSWISDLIGWAMLYEPHRPLSEMRGIVLVDEIEQHLHPRWQAQIVKLLRDQFPGIQFIGTTHTPMCAVGTTQLSDAECELIKLQRSEGLVYAIENVRPPRGQRADQVLTSLLFELATSGDDANLGEIVQFNQLSLKARKTKADRAALKTLHEHLKKLCETEETEFETTVRREVRRALRHQAQDGVNPVAADFEVLRQLRAMTDAKT